MCTNQAVVVYRSDFKFNVWPDLIKMKWIHYILNQGNTIIIIKKKKVLYVQDAESRGLPVLSSQGGPPLFCSIAGLIEKIKYKCFWAQITVQNRKLGCIQWGSTDLYLGLGPYRVQLRSITVPINCLISFVYASNYGGFPCLIA